MKKRISYFIVALCTLMSTVYASETTFVGNHMVPGATPPAVEMPKEMLYKDNYLVADMARPPVIKTQSGEIMIALRYIPEREEKLVRIPNSKKYIITDQNLWMRENINGILTYPEVQTAGKYVINPIEKKMRTPDGQLIDISKMIKSMAAGYYYSETFIETYLGIDVQKQIIDGITCVFVWEKEPEGTIKPNMTPKEAYLRYERNPNDLGYTEELNVRMSGYYIGGNISNTKTRPKDSTLGEDFKYLKQVMGNYSLGLGSYGHGGEMNINKDQTNNIRTVTIKGWHEYMIDDTPLIQEQIENIAQENLFLETFKYFSQDAEDGYLIFEYLRACWLADKYPPFGTKMTFGRTEVVFEVGGVEPSIDVKFNQNNWGDTYPRNYNDFRYTQDESDLSYGKMSFVETIGSNAAIQKVREPNSTLAQDISYLNSIGNGTCTLLDQCIYPEDFKLYDSRGIAHLGRYSNKPIFEENKIEVTSGNGRKFTIGDYWYAMDVESYISTRYEEVAYPDIDEKITFQNGIIETIKYFSKAVEDGEAIYLYLNNCIMNQTQPTLGQEMTFGKTKVVFTKGEGKKGYSIEFIN